MAGPDQLSDMRRRLDALRREIDELARREVQNGALTGGGTIATGGFTLTVPATGTAMLLSGNQTVAGVKTFSDGISFGNETLANYDEGTWTPAITGSGGNPTVNYTVQTGDYTQIGRVVFFHVVIVINTTSGGSGDVRVSVPHTVTLGGIGNAYLSGPDLPGTGVSVTINPTNGQAYATIQVLQDNAAASPAQISGLAAGDVLAASGWYFR